MGKTKSQLGKMAKNKGSNFERKIAKLFSIWAYGEEGFIHRVPRSGGTGWNNNAKAAGDITADSNTFPFSIECKNQESWNLDQLFTMSGTLLNFINQAKEEGEISGKTWLLILKKNRHSPKIIFDIDELEKTPYISIAPNHNTPYICKISETGEDILYYMELKDFFDLVSLKDVGQ